MLSLESLRRQVAEHPGRAGLYAFAAVSIATLGLFAIDHVLRPDRFTVHSLSLEGEFRNVDAEQLSAAVMDSVHGNFFLLNLDAVRAQAKSVPWVHSVDVRRRWPDGVHIRFTEQRLVARWGNRGWVNDQGEAVDLQGAAGPADLPLFTGPDGMQSLMLEHYRSLTGILAESGLEIATLALSARHSWNITLGNGIQLTLGRETPEPKVARFARVYPQALASQAGRLRRIDLRYTNGFAIEWNGRTGSPRTTDLVKTGHQEG